MASGFYRDNSPNNWYYLQNNHNCTDGWRTPYVCFDSPFEFDIDYFEDSKILIPLNLVTFNDDN